MVGSLAHKLVVGSLVDTEGGCMRGEHSLVGSLVRTWVDKLGLGS